jgi:hypothetical protein
MKISTVCAALAISLSQGAGATNDSVRFDLSIKDAGKEVSAFVMRGQFGRVLTSEISGVVKVEAMAEQPGEDGLAMTTIRVFRHAADEVRLVKETSMRADLSKTPSFQYNVPGTSLRVELKPRADEPSAASK